MTVGVTFRCDGCDAIAGGSAPLRPRVTRTYIGAGIDRVETGPPDLFAIAPEGWVVFDPYTRCTYCPVCAPDVLGDEYEGIIR